MNENLKLLQQDIAENQAAMREDAQKAFPSDVQLTEEEQARIDAMRQESTVYLSDKDENGEEVAMTSAKEYAKPLDDNQVTIRDIDGIKDTLKVINNGDIEKSIDDVRAEAKQKALSAFKSLAVGANSGIADEDYLAINDRAIADLQAWAKKKFGTTMNNKEGRIDVDRLISYMNRMPLTEICNIFSPEFLRVYMTPDELQSKNVKAKERLLTSIAYLLTTGPELDYLNDYIDHEERLMVVSKRLAQCQVDFAEMLKDEKTMSELLMESRQYSPKDESFWSKYIQDPKLIHSKFAHNIVIYNKYKDAYTKVMEQYPDVEDPTIAAQNQEARDIIQHEIDECDRKIEVYKNICDLTLMKELWGILVDRLKNDKRISMNYLEKEAIDAIERIRRSKQNVPFPGFKGTERKAEQIYTNYLVAFRSMISQYNTILSDLEKKGAEESVDLPKNGVVQIGLDGYDSDPVYLIFGLYTVILMGRILKRCTKTNATKSDAITLDAYFQIFCNLGTDLYMMTDVWNLMKDFIQFTMDRFYLPSAKIQKEKDEKKIQNRGAVKVSGSTPKKIFNASSLGAVKGKKGR